MFRPTGATDLLKEGSASPNGKNGETFAKAIDELRSMFEIMPMYPHIAATNNEYISVIKQSRGSTGI